MNLVKRSLSGNVQKALFLLVDVLRMVQRAITQDIQLNITAAVLGRVSNQLYSAE